MATNKKPKKKKKQQLPTVSLKPTNLIAKKGRSMPIFECWRTLAGVEGGKADIIVARRMENGNLAIGFFLIDLWCLGLKDTFYRTNIPIAEFRALLDSMGGSTMVNQIEPALAFNMVYAGIEYAEDIGFEPHKEFKTTQYLLPEPDDFEYIEIETGLNGRPCYYPGPDDRVEAILAKLDKNVGKGNYDFDSFGDPRIHGDFVDGP